MADEELRSRLVAMALGLTADTPLAASPYEIELLNYFVKGLLTIEEVIELADNARAPAPK